MIELLVASLSKDPERAEAQVRVLVKLANLFLALELIGSSIGTAAAVTTRVAWVVAVIAGTIAGAVAAFKGWVGP